MRALARFGLLAALLWPASCSVKKVRFTAATDAGRTDAPTMDTRPLSDASAHDASSGDARSADAMPRDAAGADAAVRDASAHDASPRDAMAADARAGDAAAFDAGRHDAGPRDAGPHDAATAEAGAGGHPGRDAGGSDAHDAGPTDALTSCGLELVPAMTGPNTPSGAVFSSGSLYPQYDAWYAFDSSTTSMWISSQAQVPTTIGYAWDDGPRTVLAYAITYANGMILSRAPSAWTFQGLQNDTWITLDSRQGETGWKGFERRVYTVAAPGPYVEYRLSFTDDNDSTAPIVVISVGDLELLGCAP